MHCFWCTGIDGTDLYIDSSDTQAFRGSALGAVRGSAVGAVSVLLVQIQADIAADWKGWLWIECVFVLAFMVEIGAKLVAFR